MFTTKRFHALLNWFLAICIVSLAIVGGALNYSPVPFWDMWDGVLDFVLNFSADPIGELFAQHNEHRIVLGKILFLIDYYAFGGRSVFLIFMNFALVSAAALVFCFAAIRLNATSIKNPSVNWVVIIIIPWLFLWMQNENLKWAFQGQFFLAQLLPLIALLAFARSWKRDGDGFKWFVSAIVLSIASAGTMANGLLVLPTMLLGALVMRMSWKQVAVVSLTVAVVFGAYFFDYVSPAGHGSVLDSIISYPIGIVIFVLRYLGSPFNHLFGWTNFGGLIALAAGLVMVASSVFLFFKAVVSPHIHWLRHGLILFLVFIGGTAFVTAGGRVAIEPEFAFSSRYTTPALMAWAGLFCLTSPYILAWIRRSSNALTYTRGLTTFALLSMLANQLDAAVPNHDMLHKQRVATLALELGVRDTHYIHSVFPFADGALNIAKQASEKNLSVFGMPYLRGLSDGLGEHRSIGQMADCQGHLDRIEHIEGTNLFVRVYGWQFDSARRNKVGNRIEFIDDAGRLVGAALPGAIRSDVATALNNRALRAGFTGYILKSAVGKQLIAIGNNCSIVGTYEPLFYNLFETPVSPKTAVSVSAKDVLQQTGWNGADFAKQPISGLEVFGTYVNSDADQGRLEIRLSPGDRLLYRSGPTSGKQTIRQIQTDRIENLPVAADWVVLEFPEDIFTENEMTFVFEDKGSDWGEWSAIAVVSNVAVSEVLE